MHFFPGTSIRGSIATEESLGMPTSAGSFALLDMPVEKDAFIVARLREAGAISESPPLRVFNKTPEGEDL